MSPEEIKQVVAMNHKLMRPIHIRLVTSGSALDDTLKAFGRQLVENAQKIRVVIEKDETAEVLPGLYVTSSMVYHAVPHGTELPPFLDLLVALSEQRNASPQTASIKGFEIPARLKLYVSSMCTFCPAMVRKLVPLVLQYAGLRLMIIDAMLFPDMADADHIRSVPTLILDDQFRWTGAVDQKELLDIIQDRDPAQLSAETLASMISDGDAYGLAEMMLKKGCILPGFIDLLTHEAFSTRLGAMAAAEEIAERRMSLASQMTEPLVERFEEQIDTVKGDILYLLGMVGDNRILGFLNKIACGEYPEDVKEAATEAIEDINAP